MSDGLPLFVHSCVDDAGLSAQEFRVLAHIARRGNCTAAIKSIAAICRLETKTVRLALKALIARQMIRRTERRGHSSVVVMLPAEQWTPLPNGTTGAKRYDQTAPTVPTGSTPLPNGTNGTSQTAPGDPYQTAPAKVTPIKGIPLRQSNKGDGSPGSASPLSGAERVTRDRELGRVMARITKLRGDKPWNEDQKALFSELKEREADLKQMLGVKF